MKCLIVRKKHRDEVEMVRYIEGEPKVGVVPVPPGVTNTSETVNGEKIVGLNTEDNELDEGIIRFDILFYVRLKDGLTQIIVNIECQKDEPTKYKILNRATYYVSRMISSQKERDFEGSNFNDMKRCFSVWLCMNLKENCMNHLHFTNEAVLGSYQWKGREDLQNIVMIGLSNELPEHDERYELHRLLGALLSKDLPVEKRIDIMENEYNISVEEDFRKEVGIMCNLSEGVWEDAVEETSRKFIMNMYNKGYTVEQISDVMEASEKKILEVIEKNKVIMA